MRAKHWLQPASVNLYWKRFKKSHIALATAFLIFQTTARQWKSDLQIATERKYRESVEIVCWKDARSIRGHANRWRVMFSVRTSQRDTTSHNQEAGSPLGCTFGPRRAEAKDKKVKWKRWPSAQVREQREQRERHTDGMRGNSPDWQRCASSVEPADKVNYAAQAARAKSTDNKHEAEMHAKCN